ncbi:MAG: NgoPII family restriction endonuclease [Saprospiraceae bacterium]
MNILQVVHKIAQQSQQDVTGLTPTDGNRLNNLGLRFEHYIRDLFLPDTKLTDAEKEAAYAEIFSYLGNAKNPPDFMLKAGDAIEVKKMQNLGYTLPFNSSYPKAKLYANDPMITKACKAIENWEVKDIIYAVGYFEQQRLRALWMVYGTEYAADNAHYQAIINTISEGMNNIPNVEFAATKELGKIKKVDPFGVTDFRIRGMWYIHNPKRVFEYLYPYDEKADFQFMCLLNNEKFASFPLADQKLVLSIKNPNFSLQEVQIKDPNAPEKLIPGKLIVYKSF